MGYEDDRRALCSEAHQAKLDSDKFRDEAGNQTGGLPDSCTRFKISITRFNGRRNMAYSESSHSHGSFQFGILCRVENQGCNTDKKNNGHTAGHDGNDGSFIESIIVAAHIEIIEELESDFIRLSDSNTLKDKDSRRRPEGQSSTAFC